MENQNGLKLILAIRRICGRAATEGKTFVRPATLRRIDRQISQLRKTIESGQADNSASQRLIW